MEQKKVIALMCERSADLNNLLEANGHLRDVPDVAVVKFPCSGMIQTLMIDNALKGGAAGVIVCGCQIGDCYYREGNKAIRERLLGDRPPGLKKTVDRRRVLALWLSRVQAQRFVSETKEFVNFVGHLEPPPPPAPTAAPAKAAAAKTETPAKQTADKKEVETRAELEKRATDDKPEAKSDTSEK